MRLTFRGDGCMMLASSWEELDVAGGFFVSVGYKPNTTLSAKGRIFRVRAMRTTACHGSSQEQAKGSALCRCKGAKA
jgi:hypothetical protein